MRLVKLADLSDEERRKALEEQQTRLNKNRQESQNIQNEANQKFNDYVSQNGAYDTNKNTTTIGDLRKAYRNTPSYNNIKASTNELYRNSIWNDVKNTFNNLMVNEKQRNNTYNRGNQSIDQQALEQNNNANFIMQMQNVNKAYRQDQEDKLKGSIAYKQAKLNNPNVSDKELLKIAQNENTKLDNGLLKDISSKNGAERIQEIKSISKSQSNPLFYDNNKFRKINNSVLQYKIAEESQEQADKINKDLKNGKISSSVEHVLEALPTKAMEAVASPIYATGSLMNLKLPTATADQDLQDWKAISSKYDQTTGNIESGLVRSASNVSGTIGYMIPSILASAIAPETNLGRITQGASVGGQSYIETLNDDASNKLQSALTGLGKGTASYAIEGIAGGNILGKGSLDDLAVKTIASKTSNEASKKIASMVYEVGGEVFEEELENQVDYLVDKIVNDKGISLKEWLTEQKETVKSTIASTLVLKLLGLGGNTYKDVKEYEYNADAKKWINEAEKIIKKENLQFDIDKLKENNNQAQNIINNNQNLQQNTTQNQFNSQEQQIIPVQDEDTSKSNITGRNDTKNTIIKDFNESAKQYNIDYKNEDLKEINQMFEKRGINAYFDENTFQNNNDAFSVWKPTYDEQGNISGREVVFNPKAQDTNTRVQELAIHELGHDLDLNEVQDMILKDASTKENWESARKSLENTYKHAYENDNIQISDENFNKIVDEEATMSILQRELGSQEYVNRLVNQNQSFAKKIYNWVIDKLNKFTGGKNEKLFWTDMKNKFETAYNQEFRKNEDITKFSIAGRKSLDNIRNDNYFYNRGINAYDTAQKLAKQNNDNEQIRQKTGWFQDKNGDWKYEFSDKDMSLKNIKIKSDKTYKLSDILEHDTLFTLYPQLKELKVQVKNMDKIGGNYNKNNKSITLSTNSIKNNKVTEGTLIHEIQHAIQDIEGHELGTTSKLSKKNYYESLGEIEADNTRTRFVNEKYNNMDISNVAPESSKINPKHRLYDHYMNNRNTIDKIKDSMFKYFKRLGDSNEGYQETNQENIQQSNRLVDDGRNGRHVESENNSDSFNLQKNKQKQLDIIQKNNKMQDDYHTGIRNIKDIKTFEEAIQDNESFVYGDYSLEDAQRDLERQKVTVYSSKPISQGGFVSTSKNMAQDYAGKGKVYSKEVSINDVAWINGDEGQYANINQKYALPIKDWQQFVEKNYQKQGTGNNLKEYNLPTKEDVKTKLNLPTKENINTQGEMINWNDIERPEGKIRKHYRSIIESNNTTKEAKTIAKELMGTDTYVPETNKGQLAQADARINNSNPDIELKALTNRVIQGERVSSTDIAVGERLIQYYSKIGDKTNLQEAIQTTAMAGTSAGQTVQALAMLNHQTPQGQATWIQRSVDKMNNELAKKKGGTITKDSEGNVKVINKLGKDITDKVDLFNLTPDMIEKIINSKDKQTMYENIDSIYEELGSQVPKSTIEKIDSWRYFSMLANPRTHIRNMVGNFAMGKMQRVKDKLAGGIEDVVGTFNKDIERTKTLRLADDKTKNFAKNDVLNTDVQSMMELNENKYNPQSRLQNARKTFKNDVLENTLGKLFDWNDKALEAEDALGLKSAYKKALTDYLTANKIDTDKITDAQLSKARTYAVQQAKEATFHQANSIATAINQFSRKNKLTKGGTDAVLPFVKTPLNVAKSGLEYNPTGLLKTITVDTVKLRKGDITVNKYIDNLSKGLTGTGIAVLGYALADAGILKASGGDDEKKESYDEALGKQSYSIQINGKTYSLDWLAPAGIPLFTGAEAYSIKNTNKNEKNSISSDDNKKENQLLESLENWANGMAKSISPMSEMSMISGLTSALSSYSDDKLSAIGTNAVKSYVNQFVPTLLGQVAKTTDDYERSTTSTKTGLLKKSVDQTKLQMMSKIPGLRQKLPTKADIWGNEQKSEPIIPLRVVNNFINPATVKNINTSKVDEELNNLYSKIGEATILPSTIDKKYTINGQNYRMTDDEYAKYKKDYGQTSYKLLDGLINSKDYNNLDDEQKQKAIETVYSYAKMKNKVNYANNENETVETKTIYNTLEELEQKGGDQSAYLGYVAKTKDITGEGANKQKIGVLANSDYSDKTKEIIYKNTEGSNDKKIILVDKLKLPINEYLNYKSQKFENDKDSDGETISGSKKQKVYNYLNSISDKSLSQNYKKIICKIEGINDYDNDIVNFVNNNKELNYDKKTEILKDIGFKIDKNGKIQTKSMIPIYKYVK